MIDDDLSIFANRKNRQSMKTKKNKKLHSHNTHHDPRFLPRSRSRSRPHSRTILSGDPKNVTLAWPPWFFSSPEVVESVRLVAPKWEGKNLHRS